MDRTLEAIEEKSQEVNTALGIQIEGVFPPRQVTTGMTIQDKVRQIEKANFVLMNITPRTLSDEYVVNSGVLIEYGIVIGLNETGKLSLFCDTQNDRTRLSPVFHGHDIQAFGKDDHGLQLKTMVKNILTLHIRTIVEKSRQMDQSYKTAQDYIHAQITDSGRQNR